MAQAICPNGALLGYALDVIVWATHCTIAAINKMMVMRPEIVARAAAGLDRVDDSHQAED
jgi:hypothetical protein